MPTFFLLKNSIELHSTVGGDLIFKGQKLVERQDKQHQCDVWRKHLLKRRILREFFPAVILSLTNITTVENV